MKNFRYILFAIGGLFVVSMQQTGAQGVNHRPRVSGTGRTTNHICMMMTNNPESQPFVFLMPPAIVPAAKGYQPYIVPDSIKFSIPARDSALFPVNGYCLDIHTLPVPVGVPFPPVDSWITPANASSVPLPGQMLSPQSGFVPLKVEEGFPLLTYPDTDIPFPYTIDLSKNTQAASGLIFEFSRRIIEAFDVLQEAGQISTPIPDSRERTEIIQQTIWYVMSILQGDPYKKEQLHDRIVDQYVANSGIPIESAPLAVQQDLEKGVDQIWETISLVGTEAKVLYTKPSGTVQKKIINCCKCGDLQIKFSLKMLRDSFKTVHTNNLTFKFDGKQNHQELSLDTFFKVKLKKYDIISIVLEPTQSPWLNCDCEELNEQNSPIAQVKCTTIYASEEDAKTPSDTVGDGKAPFKLSGYPTFDKTEHAGYPKTADFGQFPGEQVAAMALLFRNLPTLTSVDEKWQKQIDAAKSPEESIRLEKEKAKEIEAIFKLIEREAKKINKKEIAKKIEEMRKQYGNGSLTSDKKGRQYLFVIRDPDKFSLKLSGSPVCADLASRCTQAVCNFSIKFTQ